MRVQGTRNGEVSTLVSVEGTMRQGRGSAEGVGARSGKGLQTTDDGNPEVGIAHGRKARGQADHWGRARILIGRRYPTRAPGFTEY